MSARRGSGWLAWIAIWLALLAAVAGLVLLPWWGLVAVALIGLIWLVATRTGRLALSATRVGVATIPNRIGSASVIVVGIAGVVGVLVALLAMAAGFEATLQNGGRDDTVIVLRGGAQTELNSVLDRATFDVIAQEPQIARDAAGKPLVSRELAVVASLPKRSTGLDANVELRGVGERAWALRPSARLIAGRTFTPGLRELLVGKRAREQFVGVDVGSSLKLNGQLWQVVGAFEVGDASDSDLWGDFDVVGPTYRRGESSTSILARLSNPASVDAFKVAVAADPRLGKPDVSTTRAYFTDQSAELTTVLRILGRTIGFIMAIGAVFGALNSMYAAISTRTREIATMRAIGFRAVPVVTSVMLETMLLAFCGGLAGAAVAWLLFDNYTASTLGQNFSQVVFSFRVTPALLWQGLKWALAIGLIGGLFPALRAARLSVTDGLREL